MKFREFEVLLVEDDPDDLELTLLTLKEAHITHLIAVARDGQEALDYLRKAPVPDLIILDLWMPVMDGWEFRAEQIKDPRLKGVPVIVVYLVTAVILMIGNFLVFRHRVFHGPTSD